MATQLVLLLFILHTLSNFVAASELRLRDPDDCGKDFNGTICPGNHCCSYWGHCGDTPLHCCDRCQSQCHCPSPPPPSPPPPSPPPPSPPPPSPPPPSPPPPSPPSPSPPPASPAPSPLSPDVAFIITEEMFNTMLLHRNEERCPARNFYTYEAFITAANSFPEFGTVGDTTARKRDLAGFFAQTSHQTRGGWPGAPEGEYAWGYCYFLDWAVADNSYNYKGVSDPTNATLVFENAIRHWMTEQARKPSCHSVMTGGWIPTDCDVDAGRLPGFGVTTNVIDGEGQCGEGANEFGEDRKGFYQHFCGDDLLAVDPGNYLDCYNQVDFTRKPPCPGWTVI